MAAVMEFPHIDIFDQPFVLEELLQLMDSDPFESAPDDVEAFLEQLLFEISDQQAVDIRTQSGVLPSADAGEDDSCSLPAAYEADKSIMVGQRGSRMECEGVPKRAKADLKTRIGFRTRSAIDVLEDGYRWRKYGKKSVKSSPNLRNYYRCSTTGCTVKKRVERDADDASCVITMYEGAHNHLPPNAVYFRTAASAGGDTSAVGLGSSEKSTSPTLLDPQPWENHGGLLSRRR